MKGTSMSTKTAAIALTTPAPFFNRLMNTLDRILMASARAAIRNGDVPHFGL
jgi:hypothetical protein